MQDAPALARLLLRFHPRLVSTPSGQLRLPGRKLTGGNDTLLTQLLSGLSETDQQTAVALAGGLSGISTIGENLHRALLAVLLEKSEERPPLDDSIIFSSELPIPLKDLKYIFNFGKLTDSFLYHEKADGVYRYDYDAITDRLKALLGKAYTDWVGTAAMDCVVEYRPHYPRIFPADTQPDFPRFNTWNAAPWAKDWQPPAVQAPCPPEALEYLEAFAGDKESLHYLQCWLRDATFSRANAVLVLAGTPGSGKNIFIEELATALVGKSNFAKATRGFAKGVFQAAVSGCRLFFMDEANFNDEAREVLKAYHNKEATLERKHSEVGRVEKIYASLAIANNYLARIRLEYSDRKFYVPKLATKSLLSTLGKVKIQHLVEELLPDPAYQRAIADYLYTHFPAGASETFPKTELFKRLCINSYPPLFRVFLDHCKRSRRVDAKTLNKRQKVAMDAPSIQELIDHYEVNFGEKLATLEKGSIGLDWGVESHIYDGASDTDKAL